MNSIQFLAIFILIMVPVFISTMFIPYWTRRTESFGVSIPEEIYNHSVLKAMRKRYAQLIGVMSIVTLVIFVLIGLTAGTNENLFSILFSIMIFLYIVGSFMAYLTFHRKMKTFKAKQNWAEQKSQQVVINTRFREQKLTHSNLWFSISFLLSIASIVISLRFYDKIPNRIPMQYNFDGDVTNWSEKSYRTVLLLPIMQLYLTFLFLFINTMIAKAKQQVSAEKPEQSIRQNIIFRRRWSAFIIITGTGLTILFSIIQLSYFYSIDPQVMVIVPLLFGVGVTIGTIILALTTGQGGSRVKTFVGESGETQIIDRDDDRYWKLGQFYFNKNDPSLFIEKRFGVGWTINFARPLAITIFLLIILIAIGLPILLGG